MKQLLQLRYPTYNSKKEIWISAVAVATLVYLFLVVFQPFGTYNYLHVNKYLLLLPYAAIAFFGFLTGDFIVSKHFQDWTWKNEVSKTVTILFLCSLLNYEYSIYFINDANFNLRTLTSMIVFTFALGIPICAIYILGRYGFLRRNLSKSGLENPVLKTDIHTIDLLSIVPDVGEKIELPKKDFLFAQSEGNYVHIFYLHQKAVRKQLVRISLKNLERQIGDGDLVRCHRSYIFNSQKAVGKKGNAQGFKIALEHTLETVPVSRKYIDIVQNLVK